MSYILKDRFTQVVIGIAVLLVILVLILQPPGMTSPQPNFVAETLFTIPLGFAELRFTNSMLMTLLVAALLVIVCALATRKMGLAPGRLQNFVEAIVEMLLGLVESTAGKRVGRVIFPLIATLFIFIITANWLALTPIGWFGYWHTEEGGKQVLVPFLRAPNADLNMTLSMALIAFIVVQISGVVVQGAGGYLKELTTPILLAPIHIIGELSRIISLSFRLFGNIFGGEVLLAVMYFLLGSIFLGFVTVIFVGLEVLFGTIQALIFSLLTLVYISMAVSGHAEGHEPGLDEHAPAGEGSAAH